MQYPELTLRAFCSSLLDEAVLQNGTEMKIKTLRVERTAAEMNKVVKTTRRRRRILLAGYVTA